MGRHSAGAPREPVEQPIPEPVVPSVADAFLGLDAAPAATVPTPAPAPLPGALGTVGAPTVAPRPSAPKVEEVAPAGSVRRDEVKAQQSRRRFAKALSVLVVLGLIGTVVGLLVTRSSPKHHRAVPAVVKRTQRTLLLTVGSSADTAIGVLLAEDPKAGSSSLTLLPSRLLANVAGRGTQSLGKAFANADPTIAANTVSDTLGVLVDGTWKLQSSGLIAMIDQLGGVVVDVDAEVIINGQVVLNAGPGQRLSGANALAYISALTPDQDESVRLGHLRDVIRAVLVALPKQAAARADLVGALGAASNSSLSPQELGAYLAGLGTDPDSEILPVLTLDSGGVTTSYRVDPAATKTYVNRVLAASIPDTKGLPLLKVFVFNGTGAPNLGAQIRPKLVRAGMTLVGSQNAATFDRTQTLVVIKAATPAARAAGQRVLAALGLPASALRVDPQSIAVADVYVEVGSDLKL